MCSYKPMRLYTDIQNKTMKLTSDIISLFELYIQNKATAKQCQEVDLLVSSNKEAAIMLKAMQLLKAELINAEIEKVKLSLTNLNQSISKSQIASTKKHAINDSLDKALNYTIEQLQKLFAPVHLYEQIITDFSLRSTEVRLLQPEAELDCKDYQLHFELQHPQNNQGEIEIYIENNQHQELYYAEFDADEKKFNINLTPNLFTTGRYYWKFAIGNAIIINSFFINKDLMPA